MGAFKIGDHIVISETFLFCLTVKVALFIIILLK